MRKKTKSGDVDGSNNISNSGSHNKIFVNSSQDTIILLQSMLDDVNKTNKELREELRKEKEMGEIQRSLFFKIMRELMFRTFHDDFDIEKPDANIIDILTGKKD